MTRNWIVVGDPTSSGGRVVTGSPFTDIDGMPVSRVTDQATCPRHKGAYPIVDGDSTMIVDGQPVALHGSSLACGCKVLSAQQMRVFIDSGGNGGSVATVSPTPSGTDVATSNGSPPALGRASGRDTAFGATFLVRDKATGEPLSGAAYKISLSSGEVLEGVTGPDGMTCAVHSASAGAASVQVIYRSGHQSDFGVGGKTTCETCEC